MRARSAVVADACCHCDGGCGANRRGSAGSRLGTGSRLAGAGSEASAVKKKYRARLWLARGKAGVVKLRAAEAGTAKAQGSGVAEKQKAGRENMK